MPIVQITSLLRQTLRVGVGVREAFACAKASACAEALPWHYGAATPTIANVRHRLANFKH